MMAFQGGSFAFVLAALYATGCASRGADTASLQVRVSALEQEQQRREVELQQIAWQIDAARRELARQQCLAAVAEMQAEVTVSRAACLESRSKFAECEAKNHAHTANAGILGCLGGLGAAIVTGGAATGLTVLGCGGGAALGHVSGSECGPDPVCTPDEAILAKQALQQHGLSTAPTCQ